MKVPFVDLHAQYLRYQTEIDRAIASVIAETEFIGGSVVQRFEDAFSAYAGSSFTIGCANGTDSLEMLLTALEVGPGDEIIVPALSWISTAEVVGTRGATPVFVDIDQHFTIDVEKIEERITDRTKGIIPVHLYGCPANMSRIMQLAESYGLFVIEDCAQAHGAMWNDQQIATFGLAGSFSFYPGKNLGAYGDAGAVVTDHQGLASKVRMIANHGQPKKHQHEMEGRNSRLDGLQAAILKAKLPHLETWTEERRAHAERYNSLLSGSDLNLPLVPKEARHVFHLYVIQHANRDGLMNHLQSAGIASAVHYPTPMPMMPCYSHLGYDQSEFPMAQAACKTILSLPMFPEMTTDQQDYVVDTILNYGG